MLIELVAIVVLLLSNVVCYSLHHKSVPLLFRGKFVGPGLLFISNRSVPKADKIPESYWALDVLDPTHLVTSPLLSDVGVLLLRCFALSFFAITLILEGLTGDGFGDPLGWLTFFTNWTFLLLGVWAALGVGLSAWTVQAKIDRTAEKRLGADADSVSETTGIVSQQSSGPDAAPFRMRWGPLSAAYLFTTEVVAVATLFLSFFYWAFLFSPKLPIQVDNVLKHGVNVLVILLDVLLCRTPFVTYHFQACLIYGTAYTVFMWVYHTASLHWVYDILDWSKPEALLLYALNPLFLFASFAAWYCIACAREWLASRLRSAWPMTSLQWLEFR